MTDVLIESGTLYADSETRTVSGLLVPYGVEGNTNLGRFTVDPGVFTIPADPAVVTLNTDHDREQPIGRAQLLEEREDGIHGSFLFAQTAEGDAALADYREGRKLSLSVEAKGIKIRAGRAIAGAIFGAAVVARGAFPGATLLAADVGTEDAPAEDNPDDLRKKIADLEEQIKNITEGLADAAKTPEDKEQEPQMAEPTNTTLNAASAVTGPSKREVFAILEAAKNGRASDEMLERLDARGRSVFSGGSSSLFAALNDVKFDGAGAVTPFQQLPQWVGELWSGNAYEQKIVPLFNKGTLTSKTISGFKWTTKPAGAEWQGNKSNVPTNTPVTAPFSGNAHLFAGGHDHAIEFKLFDAPGYYESYYQAMSESFARWEDDLVFAEIKSNVTKITADNPSGLSIGAGFSALIDGAVQVLANNATPTFALVDLKTYKSMLKTPQQSILGYLNAALGLSEGTLESNGFSIKAVDLTGSDFDILVGAREAVSVFELPGAPIRVEAPDLVRGGTDTNVYGAAGAITHKADALIGVKKYTA